MLGLLLAALLLGAARAWDCNSLSVDDATVLIFENFTAEADVSDCADAPAADFWWELSSPFAEPGEVTETVLTTEPSLNTTFDEVGEWAVQLFACDASVPDPGAEDCSDTAFTVTVSGGCDPGQEEDHTGVCVDCDAGSFSADGVACEACADGDYSLAGWDACVTPVFTLTWNSAPLTGQLPVDALPYTYAADAEYTLEPAELAEAAVEESFSTTEFAAYGEYTVTYTVAIADSAISASEDISVVVNDAPAVSIAAPTTVADTVFGIEVSCETQLGAAACADPGAFSFSFSPDSASIEVGDDASVWNVTAEPPLDEPQTYVITVAFADDFGAPASDVAETAVDALEFTPVFTDDLMPTFSDWTELNNSFTFAIGVSDPDGGDSEPPTCTVSTTSSGAEVSSDGDCSAISFTTTAADGPGDYAIDVTVSDADGHSNAATFPVYVYADDLLADVELTRPDSTATWAGVDPGATVVSTSFSFSPENQAAGQATGVNGTALTLEAEVLDAFVGDVAVTVHLELADHVRDLTAVLATLPAQPEVAIVGPWGDADYYVAPALPATFNISLDASIPDGAIVGSQLALVDVASVADAAVLTVTLDADEPTEFVVEASVESDYGETAAATASFWLLPPIELSDPRLAVTAGDAGHFAVDVASPYDNVTYAWTLPDGSASAEAAPAWTFTASGSSETADVVVTADPVVAELTVSVAVLAAPSVELESAPTYLIAALPLEDVEFSALATVDARTSANATTVSVARASSGALVASATAAGSAEATVLASFTANDEYTLTGSVVTNAGQSAAVEHDFWVLAALQLADPGLVYSLGAGDAAVTRELGVTLVDSLYDAVEYAWTALDGAPALDSADVAAPSATFTAAGSFAYNVTVSAEGWPVSAWLVVSVTVLAGDTSEVVAVAEGPSELLTDRTASFQLSAAGSRTSLGDDAELTFSWSGSSEFSFNSAAAAAPTVRVDGEVVADTEYTFTVDVQDELQLETASASATVTFDFYPTIVLDAVPAAVLLSAGEFNVSATLSADVVSVVYSLETPSGDVVSVETGSTIPVSEAGVHTLSAVATDDAGLESDPTASTDVAVYAEPAISVATDALFVTRPGEDEDAVIAVTASASDAVDATLEWLWTVDNADDATLTDATTDTVTLTSGVEAVYTLTATVTNSQDLSAAVEVTVEVLPTTDTRVTAVIASVPLVLLDDGDSASLDASASFSSADPNDPVAAGLTYAWSGPEGLTFADATAATTTVSGLGSGEQVVDLIVFDLNGKNGTAAATITATHAPEIALNEDNYFFGMADELPESVAFDASGTTDPDGDSVTFEWDVDADCFGATPSITQTLTLGDLERGLCRATVTATDAHGASAQAEVQYQAVELAITAPDAFATWFQGRTYDIEWTSLGFSAGLVEVFVTVEGYDELIVTVEGGADFSDDGAVPFTVPTDPSGAEFDGEFAIEVRVVDGVNEDAVSSADFAIRPAYAFSTTEWGACDSACGAGSQSRTYECLDAVANAAVDDYFCVRYTGADEAPATTRACLSDTACPDPLWYAPDFDGDCVGTTETDALGDCGAGERTRTVTCYDSTGSVDESGAACSEIDEPEATEYCFTRVCQEFEYVVRATQECSVDCGPGGSQGLLYGCRSVDSGYWVPASWCSPSGDEPESQSCNDDVSCPDYAWAYGDWSECSEACGAEGLRTREATCTTADGTAVADWLCGDSAAETEAGCNRFPCVYEWFAAGPWSECSVACGDGGTRTRDVFCVSSDDPTVLSSDCSAVSAGEACGEPCDFCDTTECSGVGVCGDGACVCDAGFSGTFCEEADGCGMVDGNGDCCVSGVVEPATSLCCESGVLDAAGSCCDEGVDACGECCADDGCDVVADLAGDCCAAEALDAQSLCCDSAVDACGVCGGDGVCATDLGLVWDGCDDVGLVTLQQALASAVGSVQILGCSSAVRRRLDESALDVRVLPGSLSLDAFAVAEAVADANYSVSAVDVAGVCGNAVCEVGEQCEADGSNAASCCLQDCPLMAQECGVPEDGSGEQCGGHGVCVQSAGVCECFAGYVGDVCDECDAGYFAAGSGSDFRCAGQVVSLSTGGGGGDDDDEVLGMPRIVVLVVASGAFLIIVTLAWIGKRKGVCGMRSVRRRHQPLFSEQTIKSQELTTI